MVGMILGNRYEILEEVGGGGMAKVYRARCRLLNRFVAVKVLKPELAADEDFLKRFHKEAQAAAALNSPHIVGVYDVGQDGDIHYIVMEYVEGQTLKEYIEANGMLSWQETVDYAIQICKALEVAHRHGIVHRDIKPHNIILMPDGVLKVTDFGIARAMSNETVTVDKSTMGSVHYFSPEQARGGYTDAKSDIYSLGIVMYEMITGRVPFDADTPVAIAVKHISQKPVSPKEFNLATPLAVEEIILKAMRKEQHLRYQSAGEMLADLYAAQERPNAALPVHRAAEDVQADHTLKFSEDSHHEVQRRVQEGQGRRKAPAKKNNNRRTVTAAVIASLVAVAVLATVSILAYNSLFLSGGEEVTVENYVDKLIDDVKPGLEEQGVTVYLRYREDASLEAGTILEQRPEAGYRTKNFNEITFVVVRKPDQVQIPTSCKTYDDLYRALQEYDITLNSYEEYSNSVQAGNIIRTEPPLGSWIEPKSSVDVYVSRGAQEVPDVEGLTLEAATYALEEAGFEVGTVTPENPGAQQVVITQDPKAGEAPKYGKKVNLTFEEQQEQPERSKSVTLVLPQGKETTEVRVVQDGVTVYSRTHAASEGQVDVTIRGNGTVKLEIYYDGELIETTTVTL